MTAINMSETFSGESVAARISRAREAAGFSTAQLARRMGIQTRTLSAWEDGRAEPRANRLVMMAGVLNVSPTWLLVGRGQAPSDTPTEVALIKAEIAQLRATVQRQTRLIDRLDSHIESLTARAVEAEE